MRVAIYSPLCQRLLGVVDSKGGNMKMEPANSGQGAEANRAALARLVGSYNYAGQADAVVEEIIHKIPAVTVILEDDQQPDPGLED